jgi:hypothetical protein
MRDHLKVFPDTSPEERCPSNLNNTISGSRRHIE